MDVKYARQPDKNRFVTSVQQLKVFKKRSRPMLENLFQILEIYLEAIGLSSKS